MRTMTEMKSTLKKLNEEADDLFLKATGVANINDLIGTPYSTAIRVKGDTLLERNRGEGGWPGGRTDFQIDRDLVIYNPDFVRLARKTQVFIGQGDVVYKNRLMHTLEVVQVARSVARKEGLNGDLAEAIAYGHDIGHTPFGHSGESALNSCLYEYLLREFLDSNGYAGVRQRNPATSVLGRGDDSGARLDRTVFTVTQCLARRKRGAPQDWSYLPRGDVEQLTGPSLFITLANGGILEEIDDADGNKVWRLSPPLKWGLSDEFKDRLRAAFWISDEERNLFGHNVHGLRVLLCSKKKLEADVTHQTAYGILNHSWRDYDEFEFNLLGKPIHLKKSDHASPEAFLVKVADDICFANSDFSDARRSGILEWQGLGTKREVFCGLAWDTILDATIEPAQSQRLQYCETGFRFQGRNNYEYRPKHKERLQKARDVIRSEVYPVLLPRQQTASRVVRALFWFLTVANTGHGLRHVDKVLLKHRDKFWTTHRGDEAPALTARAATDFIAHLTDDQALLYHDAIFAPEQRHWVERVMDLGEDA